MEEITLVLVPRSVGHKLRTHGVAQNNKYGLSRSSGDQGSEIKLSAGHVPSDTCGGVLPCLFLASGNPGPSLPCAIALQSLPCLSHGVLPLCVCICSLLRIKSCWVRAHPNDCILVGSQLNRPNFQMRSGSQVLDVRTSTDHCGEHDSTRNHPEAFCYV